MNSQSSVPEACPRRHDLVFVSGSAWRALMKAREDLATDPLVCGWIDRGWPLVACRAGPGERHGVALGLATPPAAGSRRFGVVVQPEDIVTTAPPLALSLALGAAPPSWQSTLAKVADLAARHGVEARVFGSLAWQALTGLAHLTATSDVDLLFPLRRSVDPGVLAAELDAIEREAPMRIDGEVLRADGAGVNWREIHVGAAHVLVKTVADVKLLTVARFMAEGAAA